MKHLSENTRKFTESATDEQRIKHVKEFRWIGYSDSIKILKKMDDLMDYPKSSRMPNLLLVGDSNNGKTAILKRMYDLHKTKLDYVTKDGEAIIENVNDLVIENRKIALKGITQEELNVTTSTLKKIIANCN